jgi:hypothetical protein
MCNIQEVYSKISIVKENLMKFVDIEVDQHKILNTQLDTYVNDLYTYIQNDFAKVKNDIRTQYSQDHINKYIIELRHIYDYVKVQCSSENMNNKDHDIFVKDHLTKILEVYFEHNVYNFNEDYYYILFENYNGLKTWLKTYIRNYSIIVSHYMIEYVKNNKI